jgi:IclR family transcriptional regulator, KDG regulon repressor
MKSKTSSKPKAEYAIQTVANALRMLEVFHTESEMGVSDLARRLKLHKNAAFRLLATLELAGYIRQSQETEQYRLGPRCLELGLSYTRSHDLIEQARPILEELSTDQGETVHLGTLSNNEVIHLDAILPEQLVLTGSRVGERLPSHCTALGKVLLAGSLSASLAATPTSSDSASPAPPFASPSPVAVAAASTSVDLGELKDRDLVSFTGSTIVDSMKLVDELRNVELRGYAVDLEEFAPGLCCVAAPVRDVSSKVVAALSLSGPSFRLSESALHGAAANAVVSAAARLSQDLGAPI